jgi:hypothetical protein
MIKLSSADWLKIGIENNWVSTKSKIAFDVTNMPYPSATGGTIIPGSSERRDSAAETARDSGQSDGNSVFGIVAGSVGAQMIVSRIMQGRQQNVDPAVVNAIAADPVRLREFLRSSGVVSPEQVTALQSTTRPSRLQAILGPSKARTALGRGLSAGAGGVGGYLLADWIADATINQRKGFNVASPSVIEQKAGSIPKFKGAALKLTMIAKEIAGISKSLDKNMAEGVATVLDLIRQLDEAKKK